MSKMKSIISNDESDGDLSTVETGFLRNNLSEVLSSVKHHEHSRIKVKRHNKVQASIISNDDADMFYDLTPDDLSEIQSAISSYLNERGKKGRGKNTVVDLRDVLKKKA